MMQKFPNLRLFIALAAFLAAMVLISTRSEKHHQEEVRAWRAEEAKSSQHQADTMNILIKMSQAIIDNQQKILEIEWTSRVNNEYQHRIWEAMKVHMRQEGDELPQGIDEDEPPRKRRN